MARKPVPVDDNGWKLLDRGTDLFTTRVTGIDDTGEDIALSVDYKQIIVHIESGPDIAIVTGTVTDSIAAHITQAGTEFSLPLVKAADQAVFHLAAPTGTTIDISIFAWR